MIKLFTKPKDKTTKQIKYGGFNARMCATLIDLFLSILLLFPLFRLLSPLFYGEKNPSTVLRPVIEDSAKKMVEAGQPSIFRYLHYVINDERTYQYFVAEHGLLRAGLDQFSQLLICAGLFLFFWIQISATPGKMAMSLKIVDATTLAAPTRKQFVIRFFSYFLSALPIGLGFLWIALDKKKQGWHDKLSHTVVIKK